MSHKVNPPIRNHNHVMMAMLQHGYRPWDVPGKVSWQTVADSFNSMKAYTEETLTSEAVRHRYRSLIRFLERNGWDIEDYLNEWFEQHVLDEVEEGEEPDEALAILGYDSEESLLADHGLVPDGFEVCGLSVWGNAANRQASVKVRPKQDDGKLTPERMAELVTILNNVRPPAYTLETPKGGKSGSFAVVGCLTDLHLEKLEMNGVGPEEKENLYFRALERTLNAIGHVDTIVLPVGNDLGHFDNNQYTTNRGTQMQSGLMWQEAVERRMRLVSHTIELLSELAQVKAVMVPGNHDYQSTFWLGVALQNRYREDIAISINNEWRGSKYKRKYLLQDDVALMFAHGDKSRESKAATLHGLFSTEAPPEVWAYAKSRHVFVGHLHTDGEEEYMGTMIHRMSSLSYADGWHSDEGYTGNLVKANYYIFENGLQVRKGYCHA